MANSFEKNKNFFDKNRNCSQKSILFFKKQKTQKQVIPNRPSTIDIQIALKISKIT